MSSARGASACTPSRPVRLKTRAASGLKDFELLLNEAAEKAPVGELVDIMDVGFACAYLATPFARRITGGTVYVDGGANIVGLIDRMTRLHRRPQRRLIQHQIRASTRRRGRRRALPRPD